MTPRQLFELFSGDYFQGGGKIRLLIELEALNSFSRSVLEPHKMQGLLYVGKTMASGRFCKMALIPMELVAKIPGKGDTNAHVDRI